MTRKTYTNSKKVAKALHKTLANLRAQGETFLPSERKLCEILDCSRVVLRKVLDEFEANELIIKGEQGRIIAERQSDFRVFYVTQGVEAIANYTWNHLWNELNKLALQTDFMLELALFDNNLAKKTEELIQQEPDAIIFTCNIPAEVANSFPQLKDKIPIITVDSHYYDNMDYAVVLDDYAVGYEAGKLLLKGNCKTPYFIGPNRKPAYRPFLDRQKGFCDALAAHNIENASKHVVLYEDCNLFDFSIQIAELAKQLAMKNCDGIFLFSDERVDFVFQAFSHEYSIPENMKLITLNGSGRSLSHTPPITALSHMVPEIANKLASLVKNFSNNTVPRMKKIKVKPNTTFWGRSLSK